MGWSLFEIFTMVVFHGIMEDQPQSIAETVPLHCRACHFFYAELNEGERLEADLNMSDEERVRLQEEYGISEEDFAIWLRQIRVRYEMVRRMVADHVHMTHGCPGVDMSYAIATGEAPRLIICQSPELQ